MAMSLVLRPCCPRPGTPSGTPKHWVSSGQRAIPKTQQPPGMGPGVGHMGHTVQEGVFLVSE